jgi:hypothetical protein
MSVIALELFGSARRALAQLVTLLSPRDEEPPAYSFSRDEIARLHRLGGESAGALDDQTWNDLLLDRYADSLSGEVSLFGRQVLYRRLRGGSDAASCAALHERLALLMADPVSLAALHRQLRSLRRAEVDAASLLYEQAPPQRPAWAGRTWPLPLALVASLGAVMISPLAWLGVGAVLYTLIAIQMRYHAKIQLWEQQANALQMLLRVHGMLGAGEGLLRTGFVPGREQARRINAGMSRPPILKNLPGVGEYADWFLLSNVNHYFKSVDLVFAERAFLRKCYLLCSNLEADVALARHLLAARSWCWAERAAPRELLLEQGEHPLLDDAVPLSIALDGMGAFISGQNGIGKSTFLRTVGLNVVAARAFGFCYARRARLPALAVYASMQNEDSLLGGESLYVAELRRAKELLAAADGPGEGIYLIDEVFRGTNHVESVSAAAAVLDVLAERGLVVVSSHNLILAPLLAHRLDAYCIHRNGAGQVLLPGVLKETNGVALLAERGFDARVEQRALKVARWLNEYMGAPADCAHLLQPRETAAT